MTSHRWTCCLLIGALAGCGQGGCSGVQQARGGDPQRQAVERELAAAVPPDVRSGPCSEPNAQDALLIALSTHGTHGIQAQEGVSVSCNGRVGAQRTRDGFPLGAPREVRLGADELERARELADDILRAPAATLARPPQGFDTLVTVHSEPPRSGRPSTHAAYSRASVWLAGLLRRAFPPPVYQLTVAFGGGTRGLPPGRALPGVTATGLNDVLAGLIVTIQNEGPDAVELHTNAAASRLSWQGGESAIVELIPVESAALESEPPGTATTEPNARTSYLVRPATPPPPDAQGLAIALSVSARGPEELLWGAPLRLEAPAR